MTGRRPPSIRDAEYVVRHQSRQLQSMVPGALGGRLASAAPVPWDAEESAADNEGDFDAGVDQVLGYEEQPHIVAAAGNQSISLTHTPIDGTLHVTWNGLDQPQSEWSLYERALTVLDGGSMLQAGDELVAQYLYRDSDYEEPDAFHLAVLALEPRLYWRFEETSGTAVADASGQGHGGTKTSEVVLGVSPLLADSAAAMRSNGGRVVSDTGSWQEFEHITVGFFVKCTDFGTPTFRQMLGRSDGTLGSPWSFGCNASTKEVVAAVATTGGGTSVTYADVAGFGAGARAFVVMTYDGTTMSMYWNGTLVATSTAVGPLLPGAGIPVAVGHLGGLHVLFADYDEFFLLDYAVGAEAITDLNGLATP